MCKIYSCIFKCIFFRSSFLHHVGLKVKHCHKELHILAFEVLFSETAQHHAGIQCSYNILLLCNVIGVCFLFHALMAS